ncbi:hypothetical protein V6N11_039226 [Hibiscus sabdariffa]|uniref:Uncharacterized protein n=1 Tax=Hibiscus sabdariffa TaxID=183260 RepID=A0ABR2SM97_9ROSI
MLHCDQICLVDCKISKRSPPMALARLQIQAGHHPLSSPSLLTMPQRSRSQPRAPRPNPTATTFLQRIQAHAPNSVQPFLFDPPNPHRCRCDCHSDSYRTQIID